MGKLENVYMYVYNDSIYCIVNMKTCVVVGQCSRAGQSIIDQHIVIHNFYTAHGLGLPMKHAAPLCTPLAYGPFNIHILGKGIYNTYN